MTSTLYFYKLPINLLNKNFVLESLETYLGTLTPVTISGFQYQRFEMEKRIKVNINQDYQTYNGLTKYNYLKITQLNEDESVATYYYFIRSAKQISESTIEFIIRMDVLNTFHYYTLSSSTSQNNYSLSDKSLITREHKDRFVKKAKRIFEPLGTTAELNKEYYIPLTSYIAFGGIYSRSIKIVDYENNILFNSYSFSSCVISVDLGNNHYSVDLVISGDLHISYSFETEVAYIIINCDTQSIVDNLNDNRTGLFGLTYYDESLIYRVIDRYQEGIEAITFKNSENILYDEDGTRQWYVAYSSSNAVVQNPNDTQATYVNPVQVDFLTNEGYTKSTQVANVVLIQPDSIPRYSNKEEWLKVDSSMFEAGGYIEFNGVQYTPSVDFSIIWIQKKNNNDLVFRRILKNSVLTGDLMAENVRDVYFQGINSCELYTAINDGTFLEYEQQFFINSGSSTETGTSPAFNNFDLTDPKLIKIIAFPYSPREDLVGKTDYTNISEDIVWNSSLNCLELYKAQNNGFDRIIQFGDYSPLKPIKVNGLALNTRLPRNANYESKLYHSDFYLPKFVYDSFSFGFRLENLDINRILYEVNLENFLVRYVCSGNVQSKFMFQFNDYICDKKEVQDFNNVLIVERNNEKAIFNNAYINYIRSGGFRYDTKNADVNKMTNALTISLSTIGAIGSFLSTLYTGPKGIAAGIGLTITAATKTISAITNAQQEDRAIAQKMLQLNNQSTSVSTSEDIDILTAYSGNKAKICIYQVTDYLRNALWDLFHYFGYKCNDYKIPNINSRCNFNFVQGEVILCDYTFNEEIANEITNKWREGITFMHWDSGTSSYDLYQEYENIENSLLN